MHNTFWIFTSFISRQLCWVVRKTEHMDFIHFSNKQSERKLMIIITKNLVISIQKGNVKFTLNKQNFSYKLYTKKIKVKPVIKMYTDKKSEENLRLQKQKLSNNDLKRKCKMHTQGSFSTGWCAF